MMNSFLFTCIMFIGSLNLKTPSQPSDIDCESHFMFQNHPCISGGVKKNMTHDYGKFMFKTLNISYINI